MWFRQVAEDNYKALLSFFAKFPNFTQNEFFIFGESYGGIYAPTLSLRVVTGAAKIKFKVSRLKSLELPKFKALDLLGRGNLCESVFLVFSYHHMLPGLCGGKWYQQLCSQRPVPDLLRLLPRPLWRRVSRSASFPDSHGARTLLQWRAADRSGTF